MQPQAVRPLWQQHLRGLGHLSSIRRLRPASPFPCCYRRSGPATEGGWMRPARLDRAARDCFHGSCCSPGPRPHLVRDPAHPHGLQRRRRRPRHRRRACPERGQSGLTADQRARRRRRLDAAGRSWPPPERQRQTCCGGQAEGTAFAPEATAEEVDQLCGIGGGPVQRDATPPGLDLTRRASPAYWIRCSMRGESGPSAFWVAPHAGPCLAVPNSGSVGPRFLPYF